MQVSFGPSVQAEIREISESLTPLASKEDATKEDFSPERLVALSGPAIVQYLRDLAATIQREANRVKGRRCQAR